MVKQKQKLISQLPLPTEEQIEVMSLGVEQRKLQISMAEVNIKVLQIEIKNMEKNIFQAEKLREQKNG